MTRWERALKKAVVMLILRRTTMSLGCVWGRPWLIKGYKPAQSRSVGSAASSASASGCACGCGCGCGCGSSATAFPATACAEVRLRKMALVLGSAWLGFQG